MTLNTSYKPSIYIADGNTISFKYDFFEISDSYVQVSTMIDDEWVVKNGGWEIHNGILGNEIMFDEPPAKGTKILIERKTPKDQNVDFLTASSFSATTFENSLDKLTAIAQEFENDLSFALKIEKGSNQDPKEVLQSVLSVVDEAKSWADESKYWAEQAKINFEESLSVVDAINNEEI